MSKLTKRKGTDVIVCRREDTRELVALAGTVKELLARNLLLQHDVAFQDIEKYLIISTADGEVQKGSLYNTREDCKAALMAM